jgi:hypothetical protein
VRRRHPERDPGVANLVLRAHQPLGHRRLGDEERARDVLGAQPAQRPERQGDLRIERERRMAAREDELQPLVGDRRLVVHIVLAGLGHVEQARLRGERAIAPDRRSTLLRPRIRRRVQR